MPQTNQIDLGDYFKKFVSKKVKSGKFKSESEVVRTALRLFEAEENKINFIVKALEKGENSKKNYDVTQENHLKQLHKKYL